MATEPQHHDFETPLEPFEGKNPIKCISSSPSDSATTTTPPPLIFTHGAGGTLQSDAILNFRTGFATQSPITCFQGSMNLSSRVKMFDAVITHESKTVPVTALGGRSMGARAAVMAAKGKADVKYLVLVSYPLHTGKGDVRDEILMEIDKSVKVLFVVGDRDSMCDLERLEGVRSKMTAESWRVVVEGADHGMSVKPKVGTKAVGELVGRVVVEWLNEIQESVLEDKRKEGRIWWDGDEQKEKWGGWEGVSSDKTSSQNDQTVKNDESSKPEKISNKASKRGTTKKEITSDGDLKTGTPQPRHKRTRNEYPEIEELRKPARKR
ncbi:uncharacterized protein PAC_14883 [Phialocephala subalpina]|uniref:KANL3/Tex30 alpha/beta hydrolase-like domain-containing protein n=1 Tax=Phialocephala subalpina TaxID=576137 RepID=A0A1L7XIY7_9HELO|nr:uncharacterized protein PAC_14883 [Phialocephala subalpina]